MFHDVRPRVTTKPPPLRTAGWFLLTHDVFLLSLVCVCVPSHTHVRDMLFVADRVVFCILFVFGKGEKSLSLRCLLLLSAEPLFIRQIAEDTGSSISRVVSRVCSGYWLGCRWRTKPVIHFETAVKTTTDSWEPCSTVMFWDTVGGVLLYQPNLIPEYIQVWTSVLDQEP